MSWPEKCEHADQFLGKKYFALGAIRYLDLNGAKFLRSFRSDRSQVIDECEAELELSNATRTFRSERRGSECRRTRCPLPQKSKRSFQFSSWKAPRDARRRE